eukprot:Pgem_evm2s17452
MHRDLDGDGDTGNPKTDRQRTEMKASDESNSTILAYDGDTMIYMWWFKIHTPVNASEKFWHVFQLKLVGDDVDSNPMLTFTLEKSDDMDMFEYILQDNGSKRKLKQKSNQAMGY